jgi:hypothetical protein
MSSGCTVPQTMKIASGDLCQNTNPWLLTDADSEATNADTVGQFFFEGGTTDTIMVKIDVTYEFKYPATAAAIAAKVQSAVEEKLVREHFPHMVINKLGHETPGMRPGGAPRNVTC